MVSVADMMVSEVVPLEKELTANSHMQPSYEVLQKDLRGIALVRISL